MLIQLLECPSCFLFCSLWTLFFDVQDRCLVFLQENGLLYRSILHSVIIICFLGRIRIGFNVIQDPLPEKNPLCMIQCDF